MCRVSHSQGSESASEAPFEGLKHQSRIGFSVRVQGNRSLLQKGFRGSQTESGFSPVAKKGFSSGNKVSLGAFMGP